MNISFALQSLQCNYQSFLIAPCNFKARVKLPSKSTSSLNFFKPRSVTFSASTKRLWWSIAYPRLTKYSACVTPDSGIEFRMITASLARPSLVRQLPIFVTRYSPTRSKQESETRISHKCRKLLPLSSSGKNLSFFKVNFNLFELKKAISFRPHYNGLLFSIADSGLWEHRSSTNDFGFRDMDFSLRAICRSALRNSEYVRYRFQVSFPGTCKWQLQPKLGPTKIPAILGTGLSRCPELPLPTWTRKWQYSSFPFIHKHPILYMSALKSTERAFNICSGEQ